MSYVVVFFFASGFFVVARNAIGNSRSGRERLGAGNETVRLCTCSGNATGNWENDGSTAGNESFPVFFPVTFLFVFFLVWGNSTSEHITMITKAKKK